MQHASEWSWERGNQTEVARFSIPIVLCTVAVGNQLDQSPIWLNQPTSLEWPDIFFSVQLKSPFLFLLHSVMLLPFWLHCQLRAWKMCFRPMNTGGIFNVIVHRCCQHAKLCVSVGMIETSNLTVWLRWAWVLVASYTSFHEDNLSSRVLKKKWLALINLHSLGNSKCYCVYFSEREKQGNRGRLTRCNEAARGLEAAEVREPLAL